MDPQLKCYLDEKRIDMLPGWGLPKPNQEAAYKSLAKYGKDVLPMDDQGVQDMNLAWQWVEQQFGPYMRNARIVSLQEAVDRMDKSTSTGSPFNLLYPTKRECFEKDAALMKWFEDDWELLANDPNWTCICTNSLKEEMRTDEKIDDNSIRTFTAMAMDSTVHGTRLFVDQNEKMYDSHLKTASAVGMSPLKGNWDRLYRKLKKFRKGYALDESQYDSSLRCYLMWGCAQFRWKMLRSEDQTAENLRRIKTYYRNLVNTLVLTPEGVLIFKKTGNPSGSVNTISDNTLILYCLLAFAWIKSTKGMPEMSSYEAFEEETSKALVGDDNTWTVSDEAHAFYNAKTVIAVWKTLGITTTTDSMEPRVPEELDFLSARTIFLDGVAVPLYERAKLMSSLLYAPKKHITPATTLERTAAMLTIGWTDIPFRKFCREVMDWLMEKYDPILYDDPRWILAKCQVQTDSTYYKLFTGRKLLMRPQSCGNYLETKERYIKLDKSSMNGAKGRKARGKQNRKRGGRKRNGRPNGPNPNSAMAKVGVQRKRNGASRRKQGRRRLGDGSIPGMVGNTATSRLRARSCTVTEDEFVGAVVSGGTGANFNNTAYPINPGQASLFPWLSKQAAQWEKYHFNSLEFYYKPEVSQFATAGTTGKVIFGVDFDASDGVPTTKQAMEDTIPHTDCMPHNSMRLRLNSRDIHALYPTLYVRPGSLPGASDIKTYDAGNLNVATQGIAANTAELGELRVRYSVTFSVPVLETAAGAPANNSVVTYTSVAGGGPEYGDALTTNVTLVSPLSGTRFGSLGASNQAGTLVFPAGNYFCTATTNFGYSGLGTYAQLSVQKGGVNISGESAQCSFVSGQLTETTISYNGWFSSDGTSANSAITVPILATFSTGSCNGSVQLMVVAI